MLTTKRTQRKLRGFLFNITGHNWFVIDQDDAIREQALVPEGGDWPSGLTRNLEPVIQVPVKSIYSRLTPEQMDKIVPLSLVSNNESYRCVNLKRTAPKILFSSCEGSVLHIPNMCLEFRQDTLRDIETAKGKFRKQMDYALHTPVHNASRYLFASYKSECTRIRLTYADNAYEYWLRLAIYDRDQRSPETVYLRYEDKHQSELGCYWIISIAIHDMLKRVGAEPLDQSYYFVILKEEKGR